MFRRVSIRLALLIGDFILVGLALFVASWLRPQLEFGKPLGATYIQLTWPAYLLVPTLWVIGFLAFDVYNLHKNLRIVDELQRLVAAYVATLLAFAGVLYFSFRDISRLQVLTFALILLILLVAYRLLLRLGLHFFGDKRYGTRRVLIVGAGSIGRDMATMVVDHSWTGLRLVGFVDDNPDANTTGYTHFGSLEETVRVVQEQNINEVIFALPRHAHVKLANLVAELQYFRVNLRAVSDFFDLIFLRTAVEDLGGMPMITLREPVLDPFQRLIKRSFDLVVGAIAFLVAVPVMIVVAVLIKLDSSGPIFFKQQRVGENGRIFDMLKFRTMIHDPDTEHKGAILQTPDGIPIHKLYEDPRVTHIGRFLRRTSLDELPQFFNILKGDMSLVGPRPELPWLVDKYEPWQRKRFEVPQGLTGWWQINGRADKPMHLHTEDDLYYIKNYSLWLDIRILWRTVKAVIDRRGAY
jgi:exopolysaccharide biosynthesis polyprenyl glycosylphosphotransferase